MRRFVPRVLSLVLFLPLAAGCSRPASAPAAPAGAEGATVVSSSAAPALPAPATWLVTTTGAPFVSAAPAASEVPGAVEVVLEAGAVRQAVEGFGGAFNERGWDALSALSEAESARVLGALFEPEGGLGLRYGRVPIGASDYALDRYTLNESPGDYAMERFSIERDRRHLIPFIRAALARRPGLRLWASAWTPPTWMKTNRAFDGGAFIDDPRMYAAYALYLARFVESYRDEGLPISMLVPQNEPGQLTHYPSCDFRPAQYVTFIRDHLAPTLRRRGLAAQIWLGTINREEWDPFLVLQDPGARAAITGVAVQWFGLAHVPRLRAEHPELPIMQSETECGNRHWEPGFNPERPPNDFAYAAHTFRKLRDFIGQGASSYMLWNLVLDQHGKNIDSERPWPQNAAIVVDREAGRATLTPMYWVTRHFSGLLEAGARVLGSRSAYADHIAFQNPDGSLVVELLNAERAPRALSVVHGEERHPLELPPESFGTLIIPRL